MQLYQDTIDDEYFFTITCLFVLQAHVTPAGQDSLVPAVAASQLIPTVNE